MESRVRKLEDRFRPPPSMMLAGMAQIAADEVGLEPALVLAEAERILEQIGNRSLTLEDIAEEQGVDVAALEAGASALLEKWEAIR